MKRFHSKAMKENLSDLQGQNSSDSEYRHVNGFDLRAMKVNIMKNNYSPPPCINKYFAQDQNVCTFYHTHILDV